MTSKRLGVLIVAATITFVGFPHVAVGQTRTGVEIWAAACGNCHLPQPANRYSAKDWEAIGTHMVITARLTDAQADALMEFLRANAMGPQGPGNGEAVASQSGTEAVQFDRVAAAGRSGAFASLEEPLPASVNEQYKRLCAACHGETGRGDGPVAAALSPRPPSFADSTFQASRTNEQLIAVIRDGRRAMPTFGKQLSPAEIQALVGYIRALGR
jgi:cytochrome c553